jgi:DNA-binding transcriptional MerR regulator
MWNKVDYLRVKPEIIKHFKNKGVDRSGISEYSNLTGTPLTVVLEFLIEEFPEHEEMCNEKLREIREFYGIR